MPAEILDQSLEGIVRIARKLSCGLPDLYDDLFQEMCLEIIRMPAGYNQGYYFRAAKNAGLDYLKSNHRHYTYGNKYKHISIESLADAGLQLDTSGKVWTV